MTTEAPNHSQTTPGAAGSTVGGRYVLRAGIGSGGMGTVWRAYDQLLRRDVAIKEVLIPANMAEADRHVLIERTLREARAAAGLNHPSVVRMFDVVTDGGRPWLVMELLTARSVGEIVNEDGPLSPRATAKIGLALLGALEAAHAAGILHRDVKPANVLIGADGRCVLTDFGVARIAEASDLTTPGMVLGSPHYIAPERALGGAFGPPSDLFSLGATLYTAVEGSPAFDRGDPIDTMHAVVQAAPEKPRRAGPLAPVLYGLLEKDPSRRWTIARTRTALRDLLEGPLATKKASRGDETDPHAVIRVAPEPAPVYETKSKVGGRAMLPPQGQAPGVETVVPSPGPDYDTAASETVGSTAPRPVIARPLVPIPVPAQRRLPLYTVGAGVGALVLALVLVGALAGWFSGDKAPPPVAKPTPTPTGPAFPVRAFHDKRGPIMNVPVDWKESAVKDSTAVEIGEAGNERRIRVNVETSTGTSRQWGESTLAWLKKPSNCGSYHDLGLRDVTLLGKPAAEVEYTCGTGEKLRHGIWRGVVVNGKAYHFFLSVPDSRFAESTPIYTEMVKSFQLGAV